MTFQLSVLLIALLAITGCSPAAAPSANEAVPSSDTGSGSTPARSAARQLVIGLEGEPRVLSSTIDSTTSSPFQIHEFVSLGFTSINELGQPVPKLIAEIPSVDRGTWRVTPGGSMATTYRLRDNLRWHDGTPLTVDDVAFTLRVHHDRNIPIFTRVVGAVDRLEPRDDFTFDVIWREPYALADQLTFREFTILPRHLLESTYEQGADALINSPYWGDGFIGSGPFRLQSWERGSHMELAAFDQFFLGRPKTERILVRFINDENTMVAQLLAGELDLNVGGLETARSVELASRLSQARVGEFVYGGNFYAHWTFQVHNNPAGAAYRDPRVRRAFAHAVDRVQLAEYATAGRSPALDSWIPPDDPRYRDAEPYITKYPYDLARAESLFREAGWTRGPDGVLRDNGGDALRCVIRGAESVGTLGAQQLKAAGIDASEEPIPPNLVRDPQWRATFQCVEASSRSLGISKIVHLQGSNAMSAANNWRGNNRSGWSSPELDRMIEWFTTTLDERERLQAEREMIRILTAELPVLPMYVAVEPTFLAAGFTGWKGHKKGVLLDGSTSWNAETWEKR